MNRILLFLRKCIGLFSLIMVLMCGGMVFAQINIVSHNTEYNTNFNNWNNNLPTGFTKVGGDYKGTASGTSGGTYAIPNKGFGWKGSSSATSVTLTGMYKNTTSSTVTSLEISYNAFNITDDSRKPNWTVSGSTNLGTTAPLSWTYNTTPETVTIILIDLNIPNNSTFSLNFYSDRGSGNGASSMIGLNNIKIKSILSNDPTLTVTTTPLSNPLAISAMDYISGSGPSEVKIFKITGSNLSPSNAENRYVYIEPTESNFEFSLNNTDFYTVGEIIEFPTGNGFSATTVYTRLKAGLPIGNYTDATTISYYNASTPDLVKTINLSGAVTAPPQPAISLGTFTVTTMNYPLGAGPSPSKNANISGTNLTNPITVTTNDTAQWEVSKDNSTWSNSVTYPLSGSTIGTGNKIYVRLKAGLAVATYTGALTATSTGATPLTFALSGQVLQPNVTVSPESLTQFTYAEGQGPSVHQSITVAGANLASDITVSVPNASWEISTTQSFATPLSSISYTPTAANAVSTKTIYIRLKAGLTQGAYININDLVIASSNVVTQNKDLDGVVTAAIGVINVEGNLGAFPDIAQGTNTPIATQNTLFAAQPIGNPQTKTIRIHNIGGLAFDVLSISIAGTNPADFSITNPPTFPFTIAADAVVVFEVTFNPTYFGTRTAVVTIANSSSNFANFAFNVLGTGNNAEITITGNGNNIANGNIAISATDYTLIGNANINAANPTTVSKVFVVTNSGNISLSITGITITGADASQFTVSPTTSSIAAGATGNITVTFAPTSTGIKNAVINITNNDLTDNESPYTFAVQGTASSFLVCAPGAVGSLEIIGIQDFETPATTPTWPYTSNEGTISGGTAYAVVSGSNATVNKFIGARSFQIKNGTGSINLNFNVSTYQDIELSFRLGSFSASTGNGVDPSDTVILSVSTDGVVFIDEILIKGLSSNMRWGFGATGTATKNYNNTLDEYASETGDNGISTVTLSNLPNVSNLYVRITALNNDNNETWAIDNLMLKGKTQTGIAEKTWNGTAWSGDGVPPTASQKVIIDGDLTLSNTTLEGCECQVNAGKTLTAGNETGTTPATINIQSGIIANGSIVVNNNSSLVQHNDLATYSSTSFSMKRTSQPMYRYDYTYWSSPVETSFTLNNLSPNTLANKYFKWNHSAPTPIWQTIQGGTEGMVAGKGYIVRAPQSFDVEGTSGAAADLYIANFIGKPNNGTVIIGVTGSSDPAVNKWNLIGNPYPSAIDAEAFLSLDTDTNNILGGTLYFWTHNTNIGTIGSTYSYNPADYAAWNTLGGTATYEAPSDTSAENNAPNGNIAAGQGFFIKGIASGNVTFNNSMRIAGQNDQFFRSATTTDKHRVWLNMKGTTKGFSQTLVGYVTDATNGFDNRFDGETFGGNQVTFYSMLDTKALVIQGRAVPFLDSDTVPLGYKSTLTENISIGIDHFDGLFDNQNIYLEDTNLNIVHDLKASDYTFAGVPGTFNNRFILRYLPSETLDNPTFDQQLQSVIIRKNDAILRVNSPYDTINTIWVYDLMGRLVFEQKNCNTNTFETNQITQTNQTLIVKVKLKNGAVVTEKL